ncbi:MAG: hypothetical protein SFT92_01920 [Rickettsiales bacterium]|nr:hypothetical protein [Rickettsiales bacterium]
MPASATSDTDLQKRLARLRATVSNKRDIASSRFNTLLAEPANRPPQRDLRQLLNDYRMNKLRETIPQPVLAEQEDQL